MAERHLFEGAIKNIFIIYHRRIKTTVRMNEVML